MRCQFIKNLGFVSIANKMVLVAPWRHCFYDLLNLGQKLYLALTG